MQRQSHRTPWIALALMVVIGTIAVSGAVHVAAQSGAGDTPPVMPRYDEDGGLLLPDDYLRWTFAGASLGLSYNDDPPQRESFNHTLIEPTAYDHFVRTGEFREGTMLVLLVRSTECSRWSWRSRTRSVSRPAGRTTTSPAAATPGLSRNRSRQATAATPATSITRRTTTFSCSSTRCWPTRPA